MNIPEGFVLVPVEPTGNQLFAGHKANGVYQIYCDMVSAALPVELPVYDEAKERELFAIAMHKLGRCSSVNDILVDRELYYFKSEWEVWKACAQSRDGSVSDE